MAKTVTPEDLLLRLLGEGDVTAGENTLSVEAEIEVSDEEMELVLEMIDELASISSYETRDPDEP